MVEWVRCSFQVAYRSPTFDPCGTDPASSTWRGCSSDRAINPRSHQRLDPTKSRDSDLPRKEVIQPHLRRLPPLRVGPPASGVASFHDVTGGVYKAREHIHRRMLTGGY